MAPAASASCGEQRRFLGAGRRDRPALAERGAGNGRAGRGRAARAVRNSAPCAAQPRASASPSRRHGVLAAADEGDASGPHVHARVRCRRSGFGARPGARRHDMPGALPCLRGIALDARGRRPAGPAQRLRRRIALREGGDALAARGGPGAGAGAGTLAWVRRLARAEAARGAGAGRAARPGAAGLLRRPMRWPTRWPRSARRRCRWRWRWPGDACWSTAPLRPVRLAAPPGTAEDGGPGLAGGGVRGPAAPSRPATSPAATRTAPRWPRRASRASTAADLTAAWARHLMAGLDEWQARGSGARGGAIPGAAAGRGGRRRSCAAASTRRPARWCWTAAGGARAPPAAAAGMTRLPRTLRLDPSDPLVFDARGRAGRMGGARRLRLLGRGPGGAGRQAAAGLPRRLPRPRHLRLVHPGRGGRGRDGGAREAAVAALAAHILAEHGAPDAAAAGPRREEEIAFADSLCDHPPGTVLALHAHGGGRRACASASAPCTGARRRTATSAPAGLRHRRGGGEDEPPERPDLAALRAEEGRDAPRPAISGSPPATTSATATRRGGCVPTPDLWRAFLARPELAAAGGGLRRRAGAARRPAGRPAAARPGRRPRRPGRRRRAGELAGLPRASATGSRREPTLGGRLAGAVPRRRGRHPAAVPADADPPRGPRRDGGRGRRLHPARRGGACSAPSAPPSTRAPLLLADEEIWRPAPATATSARSAGCWPRPARRRARWSWRCCREANAAGLPRALRRA